MVQVTDYCLSKLNVLIAAINFNASVVAVIDVDVLERHSTRTVSDLDAGTSGPINRRATCDLKGSCVAGELDTFQTTIVDR